jgi:predicted alpha/beta superfamily hydrolase
MAVESFKRCADSGNHWTLKKSSLLLSCTFLLAAFVVPVSVSAQNQAIAVGELAHIRSILLNEDRLLFISKPVGYDGSADRYPVLYLLDGEEHFRYTSGIVEFLAATDRIPKMIVVGIASGDSTHRTRDLTPPSAAEIDNRFSPGNGGADAFLSFLANELIPFVERTYRTRPFRVLVGHSFGGLFAIQALIRNPKVFNAYLAIDPSLAWNNGALVTQAESFFSKTRELQEDLYFTASNDNGRIGNHLRRLAAILDEKAPVGFRWNFKWMDRETHASIPLPSIHDGLDTIFDGWHLTDPISLFDIGGIEAIHKHFRDGARRYGYERTTPAFTVSLVVAGLMSMDRLEDASKVLLHDPKVYPPPWNQLDALARRYADRGDDEKAAHYYVLSLRENPQNDWAKQKLKEMGAKVDDASERRRP